ncbi:hypothetical protein L7F22_020100, partial [Adiantum nelumboides]|nr:hypothetical protein [Adiantum nelumboides]
RFAVFDFVTVHSVELYGVFKSIDEARNNLDVMVTASTMLSFVVADEDIAMYALKAALDPRAENKIVHLKLPKNHLSQNEMVSLWESKTGKRLERVFESEEDMRKSFEGVSSASELALSLK